MRCARAYRIDVQLSLALGAVPFADGDRGVGVRLAAALGVLMLGAIIWASTLAGFHRDLRDPRRLDDAVIVAHRPRQLAIIVSWVAMALTVISLIAFGISASAQAQGGLAASLLLTVLVALPVATALPGLSRRYAEGAGVIAVSPAGLTIATARGDAPEPVPWSRVGTVRPSRSAAGSLVNVGCGVRDAPDGLGARVRWRPGAQRAVARWAAEGFVPTAAEVRALDLESSWSPDPDALPRSRGGRRAGLAALAWALLACLLMVVGFLAVIVQGDESWWVGLLLVWAPVLGAVILAPRLWRELRTGQRRCATITSQGWFDLLHGQGLVRWEHIERIELHQRHTVVLTRGSAPPFRDRDLGNRLNHRLEDAMRSSPRPLPSAGPLFREIGPHHLPYRPETRAFDLVDRAAEVGGIDVRRPPTFEEMRGPRH